MKLSGLSQGGEMFKVWLENDTRVWAFGAWGLFKAFVNLNAGRIVKIEAEGKVYNRVAIDTFVQTLE